MKIKITIKKGSKAHDVFVESLRQKQLFKEAATSSRSPEELLKKMADSGIIASYGEGRKLIAQGAIRIEDDNVV